MTQKGKKNDGTKITLDVAEMKSVLMEQPDFLQPVVQEAVQAMLEVEMEECLQAGKHERSAERLGYRSGYYRRRLITRVGAIWLRVPQDRAGQFSTQMFEQYQRSEKALVAALAQMYVQGVSTRKVAAITEELCGHEFSASSISEITRRSKPPLPPGYYLPIGLYSNTAKITGISGFCLTTNATIIATNPIMELTERSMPCVMMTIVCASAAITRIEMFRRMSFRLSAVKNEGARNVTNNTRTRIKILIPASRKRIKTYNKFERTGCGAGVEFCMLYCAP